MNIRPIRSFLSRYPFGEAFLLALTALVLCQNTLTGAFGYEFSFFLGVVGSMVFSASSALRLKTLRMKRPLETRHLRRLLLLNEGCLAAPLIVVFAFSAKIATCRYDIGWKWFLLMPFVSVLFGTSCGAWASQFRGPRMKNVLLAFLPSILFSLLTIRDLFFDPSLSFLHPAFGYFAGPIYDEWIPIETSVVTYRLWTLGLSLLLFALALQKIRVLHLLLVLWVSLLLCRTHFGWHHDYASVRSVLRAEATSTLVRLFFDAENLPPNKAHRLLRVLDARVRFIVETLDLSQTLRRPVDVYIYPSSLIKHTLSGARYTSIGNPIQKAVHMLETDPMSQTFPHELTHVLASEFGMPILGIPFNVGLLEGLATAMEHYRDELSLHEWAKAMEELQLSPDLEALFHISGFWREAPHRAYLSAGSFSLWLIDTYGVSRFKEAYRGKSFQDVYSQDLAQLVMAWKLFVKSISISPQMRRRAESELRVPPIFERRCPHDVAQACEEAWHCTRQLDIACADKAFQKALDFSGKAPFAILRLAQWKRQLQEWERVKALATEIAMSNRTSTRQKALAHLLIGDVLALAHDFAQAHKHYSTIDVEEVDQTIRLALLARQCTLKKGNRTHLTDLILRGPTDGWSHNLLALPNTSRDKGCFLFAITKSLQRDRPEIARRLLARIDIDAKTQSNLDVLQLKARLEELEGNPKRAIQIYKVLAQKASTEGLRWFAKDHIARIKTMMNP